jgi:hypothetical protein
VTFDNQTAISSSIQNFGRLIDTSQAQQPQFSSAAYPQAATRYVTRSQNSRNTQTRSENVQRKFINENDHLLILSFYHVDRSLENLYNSDGSTASQAHLLSQTISYRPRQNQGRADWDNSFTDLSLTLPARTNTSRDPQSFRRSTSDIQSTSIFGPNPFATTNSRSAAQRPSVPRSSPPEASPRRNYVTSTTAARSLEGDDRPIFGGRAVGGAGRGRGRTPFIASIPEHPPLSNSFQRRDTFVLDEPTLPNLPQSGAQRPRDTVIVQELYNVRRRNRAKTPVAFTVNLNELSQSRASGVIESSTA